MSDGAFTADATGLMQALELMRNPSPGPMTLPEALPEAGLGERAALYAIAPGFLGKSADLSAPTAFAHMDPPTPWITWATQQWVARMNQNLLHPATSPIAGQAEARVIDWLAPAFGMTGGHMLPGATLANLTGIWAARDIRGLRRVVASDAAHLSVAKAAHILGMHFETVPSDEAGAMRRDALPDLADACLVLTAGTTSAGAIDPLDLSGAWTHIDAAWAGPLRLTKHRAVLDGIERADSIAISAHKWLFQPKESALVLFRDVERAHKALSFGGAYLAQPNIGLLGSHGAVALPLLATLLAWGRSGMAARIEATMAMADRLADWAEAHPSVTLFAPNRSGVILWRPESRPVAEVMAALPRGTASQTQIGGTDWIRHVAANPNAEIDAVLSALDAAL